MTTEEKQEIAKYAQTLLERLEDNIEYWADFGGETTSIFDDLRELNKHIHNNIPKLEG